MHTRWRPRVAALVAEQCVSGRQYAPNWITALCGNEHSVILKPDRRHAA
jgi:hypothetical protein